MNSSVPAHVCSRTSDSALAEPPPGGVGLLFVADGGSDAPWLFLVGWLVLERQRGEPTRDEARRLDGGGAFSPSRREASTG